MSDQATPEEEKKAELMVRPPRYLFRDKHLQLIEYQPQVRVIRFQLGGRYEKRYMSFPYVQMGRFDHSGGGNEKVSLHVSFSNEPMKSMDSPVYLPMLPNCWEETLQVCIYPKNHEFMHFIELFYSAWFTSTEHYKGWQNLDQATFVDINGNKQILGPPGCKPTAFKDWEKHTRVDPNFALRVNWPFKESWKNLRVGMQTREFATFQKPRVR